MNWTLSQLRAFCALADLGTMTAAAEHLGYTTGAISQQVAALQSSVGVALIAPEGRAVRLTEQGITLLPHARAILAAERHAAALARNGWRAHDEPVRVGIFGSAALFALPHILSRLTENDPPCEARAHEMPLTDMPEAILADRIDVAISVNYPDAPHPPHRGLVMTPMHNETFRMVLPGGTPQHLFTGPEALTELCNTREWIIPPVDTAFGKAVLFACARSGIHPRVRHSISDTALSIALAGSGTGITLATPLMLALHPTDAPIVPLPVPAQRSIVALTRQGAANRRGVALALTALDESLAGAPQWEDYTPPSGRA